MDYSTLNLTRLRRLKTYVLPATYRLQQGSGNACAGDPPGFPTYFTRSVYTQYGNSPPHGRPQTVIVFEGVNYVVDDGKWNSWEEFEGKREKLFLELWNPLPLDHERTRLWILGTYKHHNHCYNGFRDDTVIYPVPSYKQKSYRDDPKWKEEYVQAHRNEVDAFNAQLEEQTRALAIPENHNAVRIIRKFYPDYQPELDLIADPGEKGVGQWWETEAVQPTPEQCTATQRHQGSGWHHPINGSWCQWCGWHAEESEVA